MTTDELLQWANEIIFAKTAKPLDSVQIAILEGAWQGLKYEEIAKNCHRSKSHVKNIAAELWKTLSDLLGEDVHKANVRSILERKLISNIYNYGNSLEIVGSYINSSINVCEGRRQNPEESQHEPRSPSPPHSPPDPKISPIIDLADATEVTEFYDRTSELNLLKQWILSENIRLITIYGFSEIGKSAIAFKLLEQINTEFDYIIWRSLSNIPKLSTLKNQLKEFLSQSQSILLPTAIDYFFNSRCLVILDDVEILFQRGQLAGQYLTEHKEYGKFFNKIARSNHQSCVILLSWEKPREIATLEAENRPIRTLHLKGLGETAAELLREKGLTDEERWPDLIERYQGHPVWLNIIASTILELFDGRVSLFLNEENDIFIGDLSPILESHVERLSNLEKRVISALASQHQAIDINPNHIESELSRIEFWEGIQSLVRRGLVDKVSAEERSRFELNPVFKQYIQLQFQ